jgi:S-adenosylmethionine synthetase
MRRFITAESVTKGHPDKIADIIADTILDEILKQDKYARVACEVYVSKGYVIVGGEITTQARIDINSLVREVVREIGYTKPEYGFDWRTVAVLNTISKQSPDIARGVRKTGTKKQGAGDQGIMIGYATDETPEFMPLSIVLAHKLAMKLNEAHEKKILPYLRPDGKAQVTLEYQNGFPKKLSSVVVAASHDDNVSTKKIRNDIFETVIKPVCQKFLTKDTEIFINNTGRFVVCGPVSDTGATGRKNVVDAYGPEIPIGGGSFSGKDPTKLDRAGAYMARYVAKNIVFAKLAKKCLVRLAYVIGGTKPLEVSVETFNTGKISDEKLSKLVKKVFDLSPGGIIRQLNLLRPIYKKTSAFGHFGRNEFPWEKVDKAKAILKELKNL